LIGAPGPYAILISNPDGSEQTALLDNNDANTAMTWLPDGENLLYTVMGPYGSAVRSMNVNTGQLTHYFNINYPYAGPGVSPDGKRVAYEEMLPGDHYGIAISDLDGSNKRLIVDGAPIVITIPRWSPDGQWLIASVHDEDFKNNPVLVLIKVDTCQIIPLPSLSGYVSGWNR